MAWLVRDGKVLATLEVADSRRERMRGLLGRDGIDGALLLRPARSVHTFRMRFPIDVAFLDHDLTVLRVTSLAVNRLSLPVARARAVLETELGVMGSWELHPGDHLEVRGDEHVAGLPDGDGPAGSDHATGSDPASGLGDAAGSDDR